MKTKHASPFNLGVALIVSITALYVGFENVGPNVSLLNKAATSVFGVICLYSSWNLVFGDKS